MNFRSLGEFLRYLESVGELKRISVEVDPVLEVTEIATRALKQGMQALLFENVKGSKYPLAINVYASARRIELGLGKHPDQLGEELISFVEDAFPPTFRNLVSQRSTVKRLIASRPKQVTRALSQEVLEQPGLDQLPIIKCWPG